MICEFHRAVTFGVLLLASVAFISWKLNKNFNWNWFTVLLPLWIIDALSALAIIVKWRRTHNGNYGSRPSSGTTHSLLVLFFWFLFKCLLCLNLEVKGMYATIVLLPLWAALSLAIYTSFDVLKKFALSNFG